MAVFRTLLVAAMVMAVTASGAGACVAGGMIVPSPICSFSSPAADHRVVMLENVPSYESNIFNARAGQRMRVTDIVIEPGAGPIYVIIPAMYNRIFRFSGAVDEISRVVAFSSNAESGTAATGVVGVPQQRVEFSAPHQYNHRRTYSRCHPGPHDGRADAGWADHCFVSQYFATPSQMSKAELETHWAARVKNWLMDIIPMTRAELGRTPEPHGSRWPVDLKVSLHAHVGPVVISNALTLRPGAPSLFFCEAGKICVRPPHEDQFKLLQAIDAEFDVTEIVSSGPLVRANTSHGWQQIATLNQNGQIHSFGSERYKAVYDNWIRTMTGAFYDRIEPEGKAPIKVDYLVSEPIEVPYVPNYQLTLLVDRDVPTPIISSSRPPRVSDSTCFYFVDGREDPNGCIEKISNRHKSTSERQSEQQVKDGATLTSIASQQNASSPNATCADLFVPIDAKVVGLATPFSNRGGRMTELGEGVIDVMVKSPGKTFLALHSPRSVTWRIDVASGSEIAGVALYGAGLDIIVKGLPDSVPIVDMTKVLRAGCPNIDNWHAVHNGGPSAALWNQYFLRASGRELDRFIGRRHIESLTGYTDNGATFVIE